MSEARSAVISGLAELGGARSAAGGSTEAWELEYLGRKVVHYRTLAGEIAMKLPATSSHAKAIMDDALRIHAALHDEESSALSVDLLSETGGCCA